MSLFSYRALNMQGEVVHGRQEAQHVGDLEARLAQMGLELLQGKLLRIPAWRKQQRLKRRELIHFFFYLEQLLSAGVPLLSALTDLRDVSPRPAVREVISLLLESIHRGNTLSQAMQEQSHIFTPLISKQIAAGELSGKLPWVLNQLTTTLKRDDELAVFLRRLLIYPGIALSIIGIALAVALLIVIPQLGQLFASSGLTLPWHTRLLMNSSTFLSQNFISLMIVGLAMISSIVFLPRRFSTMARWIDQAKLGIPVVGHIYRKIILARWVSLFAMLYAAGITVLDALKVSQEVSGNRVIQDALTQIETQVVEGQNLAHAFAMSGVFPSLIIRMLKVGETTGTLDQALQNVGYFYERDIRESIERLQALLEPSLTVGLGAFLLWIMLAVLGPVYDIITQLKL